MTVFITTEQALRIAERAIGSSPALRDVGLLQSALLRPQTRLFGKDAYPTLFDKAAAMLHSLARNHPLVDGNKRLAWLACWVMLAKNGVELDPGDDETYDFIVAVASGELDEVEAIAARLASFPRR